MNWYKCINQFTIGNYDENGEYTYESKTIEKDSIWYIKKYNNNLNNDVMLMQRKNQYISWILIPQSEFINNFTSIESQ